MLKKQIHKLVHLFSLNTGQVEVWTDKDDRLMAGFRCSCGELMGVEASAFQRITWASTQKECKCQ